VRQLKEKSPGFIFKNLFQNGEIFNDDSIWLDCIHLPLLYVQKVFRSAGIFYHLFQLPVADLLAKIGSLDKFIA
jgi:hypothetical protein